MTHVIAIKDPKYSYVTDKSLVEDQITKYAEICIFINKCRKQYFDLFGVHMCKCNV